jgi:predicted Zn-dependent peptidase
MLTRGTENRDQFVIASEIDYYGAQLNCAATRDRLRITLVSPPAHVQCLLPLLADIVLRPTFPEEALKRLKPIIEAEIKQKDADANLLGKTKLREHVFGAKHAYGHALAAEDLQGITTEMLRSHYAKHGQTPYYMSMSGAVSEAMLEDVTRYFGHMKPCAMHEKEPLDVKTKGGTWHIPKKECVQVAIDMGHPTITLSHPDYPAFYVTNILLGGFFGSRLMSNLRETKGYTYGVHTYIEPMQHSGYWRLSTSVKRIHADAACQEISHEIERLKTTLVKEEELMLLKNYLLGNILEFFDGVFAIDSRLHLALLHGMDLQFFTKLYQTIQEIDSATIQAMAQKYLSPASLCKVVVGREEAAV